VIKQEQVYAIWFIFGKVTRFFCQ